MSLTYLGSKPAEEPWLAKTGFCTLLYFTYWIVILPLASAVDEHILLEE
jgi:hypothetical protein